ncbi:hypothetical protein Tco_0110545 [Tanacetum coccineum]
MSNNNTFNQRSDANMHSKDMDEKFKPTKVTKKGFIHYGLSILDTLLNDTIREMDAYKDNVENSKEVVVPMAQPQLVDPTQGTHKNTKALSRKERLIQELSGGPSEGFETRIETQELRDSLDSDQTHSATRLDVVDEEDKDDASNFMENISRYLNETSAHSLEDVGLPRIARKSGLNSHDGSSRKEKPRGDFVDPDRLLESQTINVPEVSMSEPTRPDQHGSTGVDSVLITLDETLTLELPPRGNPELTSCTSGASENPLDVLAQNLNFQVQPITNADDPIPSPPITTIITTKPTTSKKKEARVSDNHKSKRIHSYD